jgi:phosphoribosylanthranilate isomerase
MWDNFIQIAGVKNLEEAEMLISKGVRFVGFPLRLTVNAEDTTEAEAREIIARIKDKSFPVLISYLAKADEIIEFCNYLNVGIVQLHGEVEVEEFIKLKRLAPEIKVIKSLVVKKDNIVELEEIISETEQYVDAYITDTYDPETGAEGATGKTHDWNISKRLISLTEKPVVLAGGLNAENVFYAIVEVKPSGVDSHTGVENSAGDKDPEKVEAFANNANKAFEKIREGK